MANIRRGLGRVGKVLMMWGILVTGIGIYIDPGVNFFYRLSVIPLMSVVNAKIMFVIIAWAPFILVKSLAWVGSGFFDEE